MQLTLQQDLLGGWMLLRESGQVGGRSQLKREQFLDHVAAQTALEAARDAYLRRGYRLMFVQGASVPR